MKEVTFEIVGLLRQTVRKQIHKQIDIQVHEQIVSEIWDKSYPFWRDNRQVHIQVLNDIKNAKR